VVAPSAKGRTEPPTFVSLRQLCVPSNGSQSHACIMKNSEEGSE